MALGVVSTYGSGSMHICAETVIAEQYVLREYLFRERLA